MVSASGCCLFRLNISKNSFTYLPDDK